MGRRWVCLSTGVTTYHGLGSVLPVHVGDGLQSSEIHWGMRCFGLLCFLISSKAVAQVCGFNLEDFHYSV